MRVVRPSMMVGTSTVILGNASAQMTRMRHTTTPSTKRSVSSVRHRHPCDTQTYEAFLQSISTTALKTSRIIVSLHPWSPDISEMRFVIDTAQCTVDKENAASVIVSKIASPRTFIPRLL